MNFEFAGRSSPHSLYNMDMVLDGRVRPQSDFNMIAIGVYYDPNGSLLGTQLEVPTNRAVVAALAVQHGHGLDGRGGRLRRLPLHWLHRHPGA